MPQPPDLKALALMLMAILACAYVWGVVLELADGYLRRWRRR